MSAHTPGPWIWTDDPNDGCCWTHNVQTQARNADLPEYPLAKVADVSGEANARLIAAAPDLLAAAEALLAVLESDKPVTSREAYVALKDAVEKAVRS